MPKTHFLLFLICIFIFSLAFILQNDRGRRHPLTLWQQLHGDNILVDGSVEVLKTLDENLGGDWQVYFHRQKEILLKLFIHKWT